MVEILCIQNKTKLHLPSILANIYEEYLGGTGLALEFYSQKHRTEFS